MRDTINSDLAWYFNDAAGDLGLRAAGLEPTFGGSNDGVSEHALEAATRHRRIAEALHRLTARQQRALELAHVVVTPALRIRWAVLGELALVITTSISDPASLTIALHEAQQGGAANRERRERAQAFIATAKGQAEALVSEALSAYLEAAKHTRYEHNARLERRRDERTQARLARMGA